MEAQTQGGPADLGRAYPGWVQAAGNAARPDTQRRLGQWAPGPAGHPEWLQTRSDREGAEAVWPPGRRGEDSPPSPRGLLALGSPASPGTPQRWPLAPGLPATGAAGARLCPTQPAGPARCSGAPSARPCLRAGAGECQGLDPLGACHPRPAPPATQVPQPNSQKCSGKPMWYQKRRQETSVAGSGWLRSQAARPPGPSTPVSKRAKWPGNERVGCPAGPLTFGL